MHCDIASFQFTSSSTIIDYILFTVGQKKMIFEEHSRCLFYGKIITVTGLDQGAKNNLKRSKWPCPATLTRILKVAETPATATATASKTIKKQTESSRAVERTLLAQAQNCTSRSALLEDCFTMEEANTLQNVYSGGVSEMLKRAYIFQTESTYWKKTESAFI